MKTMFIRCLLTAILIVASLCAWGQETSRKIHALDKVKLTCTEEPLLNKTYKVTKDGVILVDFLGAVEVEGLTAPEAAARLSQRLTDDRILKAATVEVSFADEETKPSTATPPVTAPVKVVGALKNPGETPFREGLKLSEVVALGDASQTADLSQVTVKSADGAERKIDRTKPNEDLVLKPGDLVTVPEIKKESAVRNEVYVMGGVAKPGAITLTGPMTVKSAIEAAGGFTDVGSKKKIRIEREGQNPQIIDLLDSGTGPTVLANDKIVVEVSEARMYVQVDGAVRNPGYCVARPGMKLTEVIESAGGLTSKARTNKIKIVPASGGKGREVNYDEILQGFSGDVTMQSGDQVMVPGASKNNHLPLKIAAGAAAFWLLFSR